VMSGVPGTCTVHANSAREAVTKMCTLPLLAGENVGHAFACIPKLPSPATCDDRPCRVAQRTSTATSATTPTRPYASKSYRKDVGASVEVEVGRTVLAGPQLAVPLP